MTAILCNLKQAPYFLSLITLCLIFSGCMSLEGKFASTQRANVGIFADNTIAMISQVDLAVEKDELIYIRDLLNGSGTEEKAVYEKVNKMNELLLGVVEYSVNTVNVAESLKTETEKISEYAYFMESYQDIFIKNSDLKADSLNDMIGDIRIQEKFLDALFAAQPLINLIGRHSELVINEIDDALGVLGKKLDQKIDNEYADTLAFYKTIQTEKNKILKSLEQVYQSIQGNDKALAAIAENQTITYEIQITEKPTRRDLKAIDQMLQKRLTAVSLIQNQIQPDIDTYRETHRELDRHLNQTRIKTNRIRLIMLIWVRAHLQLASGVSNPAEWFDINQAPKQLFNIGTKAVL